MKYYKKWQAVHPLASVLVLIALAISGCQRVEQQQQVQQQEITPTPIPTQPAPVNPIYTVQKGDVIAKIEFTGRIAPVKEQELFFKVNGRVRNVFVQRNQKVKAGTLLADLENGDLERQLEITQLNIRRNEVQLELAQLNLDYAKSQLPSKSQKHDVEVLEKNVELAKINLDQASLDLEELKAAISNGQIVAPFDGVLLFVNVSQGAAAEGFKPIITIADTDNLEISADVSSDLLRQLQEGMPVTASFFTRPGDKFNGAIRKLPYPYGGGTGSVKAEDQDPTTRISMDIPKEINYELGDLIRVTVITNKSANALWLPPQAIRNFEGRRFVIVQEGEVQKRVDVKVGLTSEDRVEVLEGLTEGQTVVGP